MTNGKVYFLDSVHPVLLERLIKAGFECKEEFKISKEDFSKLNGDVFGIVIRSRMVLDSDLLDCFSNLKFIARSGSGLENIDTEYCDQKGIKLFNSPEGNKNAVAEHALGMLLSLMNNLNKGDQQIRKGIWKREENRGEELEGKTVGIIGFGNNGSAFAKKLKGFDVKIMAYDKYKTGFGDYQVQEATLDAILNEADVISLHIPQNKETRGMINTDFINRVNKPFYLLNLSRGKIVQTIDVLEGIHNGKIKGAGLDVLEYESKSFESLFNENLPDEFIELTKSEKVILSPHVGGWTKESYFKLSNVLADKILSWDWF